MTTPSTTFRNRENAQKSTGPNTALGKAKVGLNALMHGATAKNFISHDEEEAYQTFLAELKQQYPSSNPIVNMQLDRIAKFKVQADRIQRSIDATFAASEIEQTSDAILMDLLELDQNQKKIAEEVIAGELDLKKLVNQDRIQVATELASFDTSAFKSHDDFLFHTPRFCQLLLNEANEYKETIDEYIENHIELFISLQGFKKEIFSKLLKLGNRNNRQDKMQTLDESSPMPPKPTFENTISQVKIENLHKAAKLFGNEINKVGDIHYKILAFNQLKQFERKPLALNYDQLDKLQRYQTTLQGQLSRMVGELLELVK